MAAKGGKHSVATFVDVEGKEEPKTLYWKSYEAMGQGKHKKAFSTPFAKKQQRRWQPKEIDYDDLDGDLYDNFEDACLSLTLKNLEEKSVQFGATTTKRSSAIASLPHAQRLRRRPRTEAPYTEELPLPELKKQVQMAAIIPESPDLIKSLKYGGKVIQDGFLEVVKIIREGDEVGLSSPGGAGSSMKRLGHQQSTDVKLMNGTTGLEVALSTISPPSSPVVSLDRIRSLSPFSVREELVVIPMENLWYSKLKSKSPVSKFQFSFCRDPQSTHPVTKFFKDDAVLQVLENVHIQWNKLSDNSLTLMMDIWDHKDYEFEDDLEFENFSFGSPLQSFFEETDSESGEESSTTDEYSSGSRAAAASAKVQPRKAAPPNRTYPGARQRRDFRDLINASANRAKKMQDPDQSDEDFDTEDDDTSSRQKYGVIMAKSTESHEEDLERYKDVNNNDKKPSGRRQRGRSLTRRAATNAKDPNKRKKKKTTKEGEESKKKAAVEDDDDIMENRSMTEKNDNDGKSNKAVLKVKSSKKKKKQNTKKSAPIKKKKKEISPELKEPSAKDPDEALSNMTASLQKMLDSVETDMVKTLGGSTDTKAKKKKVNLSKGKVTKKKGKGKTVIATATTSPKVIDPMDAIMSTRSMEEGDAVAADDDIMELRRIVGNEETIRLPKVEEERMLTESDDILDSRTVASNAQHHDEKKDDEILDSRSVALSPPQIPFKAEGEDDMENLIMSARSIEEGAENPDDILQARSIDVEDEKADDARDGDQDKHRVSSPLRNPGDEESITGLISDSDKITQKLAELRKKRDDALRLIEARHPKKGAATGSSIRPFLSSTAQVPLANLSDQTAYSSDAAAASRSTTTESTKQVSKATLDSAEVASTKIEKALKAMAPSETVKKLSGSTKTSQPNGKALNSSISPTTQTKATPEVAQGKATSVFQKPAATVSPQLQDKTFSKSGIIKKGSVVSPQPKATTDSSDSATKATSTIQSSKTQTKVPAKASSTTKKDSVASTKAKQSKVSIKSRPDVPKKKAVQSAKPEVSVESSRSETPAAKTLPGKNSPRAPNNDTAKVTRQTNANRKKQVGVSRRGKEEGNVSTKSDKKIVAAATSPKSNAITQRKSGNDTPTSPRSPKITVVAAPKPKTKKAKSRTSEKVAAHAAEDLEALERLQKRLQQMREQQQKEQQDESTKKKTDPPSSSQPQQQQDQSWFSFGF